MLWGFSIWKSLLRSGRKRRGQAKRQIPGHTVRGCSLGTRLTAPTVLQGERALWPLGPHHLDGPMARTSGQAHKQLQAVMHPLRVPFPKQASPSPYVGASFPHFPCLSGGQPPVHEAIFQAEKLSKSHSLQLTPRQNCPFPTPHCTLTPPLQAEDHRDRPVPQAIPWVLSGGGEGGLHCRGVYSHPICLHYS